MDSFAMEEIITLFFGLHY